MLCHKGLGGVVCSRRLCHFKLVQWNSRDQIMAVINIKKGHA